MWDIRWSVWKTVKIKNKKVLKNPTKKNQKVRWKLVKLVKKSRNRERSNTRLCLWMNPLAAVIESPWDRNLRMNPFRPRIPRPVQPIKTTTSRNLRGIIITPHSIPPWIHKLIIIIKKIKILNITSETLYRLKKVR